MSEYADRDELAAKIDWEGGIDDALDYGIKAADLPQNDVELVNAWTHLESLHAAYARKRDHVMDMLPEP